MGVRNSCRGLWPIVRGESGHVIDNHKCVDLLASNGCAGVGRDESGLKPMKTLCGRPTWGGRRNIKIDHQEGIAASELGGSPDCWGGLRD